MRLTTIRNGLKRIISISGGFELLQMVLEPDMGQCASKNAGFQEMWTVRSIL